MYCVFGLSLSLLPTTDVCVRFLVPASNLPSDNRAAGLGGNSVRASAGNGRAGGAGGGTGTGAGQGAGRGADGKNTQSYLYPYGNQDQEIIVDIAGNDHAEDEYLLDRKRKAVWERAFMPSLSVVTVSPASH